MTSKTKPTDPYAKAGVNIEKGNELVESIKASVNATHDRRVLGGIGGFAGLFQLGSKYKNPVLIGCTDGVGTKVALSQAYNKTHLTGQDLVAMCVNDMVTPLFEGEIEAESGEIVLQRLDPVDDEVHVAIDLGVNGKSIATTMGYSPLDGLTMGTRSGGIDANAVLRLVEDNGLDRTKAILNHESGLLGLSGGKSDMRNLMVDPSADSAFAIEHFCYWSLRHAGSLIAAMGCLDAIAFTGGIGENAIGVRARILRGLEWIGVRMDPDFNHARKNRLHAESSKIAVWVVPAEEEKMIARDAITLLNH